MSNHYARNWQFGCSCGCAVLVKNVAWDVQASAEPCEGCARLIADPLAGCDLFGETEPPGVRMELGWCGCGNPDLTDELALAFLERVESRWAGDKPKAMDHDLAHTWSHICDDLGWTDHGSSVDGAWLTDDGKIALANLRTLLTNRRNMQ